MPRRVADPGSRPKVTTWMKAAPELIVAGLFDLLRFVFEWFWLFGPLIIGAGVDLFVTSWLGWTGSTVSSAVGAVAGTAAGAVSTFGDGPLEIFGVVMATATGLLGWLVVFIMMAVTNFRIFKRNTLAAVWMMGSLAISETPFVGSIPALTFTTWRMYRTQIHKEKKELKKWEAESAAFQKQQREDRAFDLMQMKAAQEVANENARRKEGIPGEMREAA